MVGEVGESIGRIHHFQHMLSILEDMGKKGFEDFKEGEAALLAWAKKDRAEKEMILVHS